LLAGAIADLLEKAEILAVLGDIEELLRR